MTADAPAPTADSPGGNAPPGTRRRWWMSWKLWLVGLVVALVLVAASVWLSSYTRWRAITYIHSHGGSCTLEQGNEWATHWLGKFGRGFRQVETINLNHLSDEALLHVAELNEATHLSIHTYERFNTLGPRGLAALRQPNSIRNLDLMGMTFSDEMLASIIAALPDVVDVSVISVGAGPETLEALCELDSIETLHFESRISDEHFRELGPMLRLRKVKLVGSGMGDEAVLWLSQGSRIEDITLIISDSLTDSGLEQLATLPSLQTLNVLRCDNITPAGVASLAESPSLMYVHVPRDTITPESVAALRGSRTLLGVYVEGAKFTPELEAIVGPFNTSHQPWFYIEGF